MRRLRTIAMLILGFAAGCGSGGGGDGFVLVVQGGAGTIRKDSMTPELEKAYRETLTDALEQGFAVLDKGGSSLDAVETAARVFEDSPLFNAGKGAVFTNQGKNELDASIMDGRDLNAGAVASVTTIKNPVSAARKVMTETRHVLLSGRGAELFAAEQGLDMVEPEYFFTQRRWDALLKARETGESELRKKESRLDAPASGDTKFGTAGAIALDKDGNLAAVTSTGGLTNKLYGRIGDSPIIGAGTYANNATCAVSSTGQGEFFMRGLLAYDVSVMMEHAGMDLETSTKTVIDKLTALGGLGGVIALDKDGNVSMRFNTDGMYRGFVRSDGKPHVAIYGDE